MVDPEEAVWGNCPAKRLWRPVGWRSFGINALLFGAHGSRNRDKKYSKINNFFRLAKRQDLHAGLYPTSYVIACTMLLFRNSSTVSLFLCHVRTTQPSQTQSLSLKGVCKGWFWGWNPPLSFIFTNSLLPAQRKLNVFAYFLLVNLST